MVCMTTVLVSTAPLLQIVFFQLKVARVEKKKLQRLAFVQSQIRKYKFIYVSCMEDFCFVFHISVCLMFS